jgi:hypothetical protein
VSRPQREIPPLLWVLFAASAAAFVALRLLS